MNRPAALGRRVTDPAPRYTGRVGARPADVVLKDDWAGIANAVGLFEARRGPRVDGARLADDVVFVRYLSGGRYATGAGVRIGTVHPTPHAYADAVQDLIARAIHDGVRPGRATSAGQARAAAQGDAPGIAYLEDNVVRPRKMAQAWFTEDEACRRLAALFPGRDVAPGPRVIRVHPQDAFAFCGLPDLFLGDLIVDVKTNRDLWRYLDGPDDELVPVGPTWIIHPRDEGSRAHRPDLYLVADQALRVIGAVDWSTVVHGVIRPRPADHDRLRGGGQARLGTPWFWVRKDAIAWAPADVVALVDHLETQTWS